MTLTPWTFTPLPPLPPTLFPNTAFYNATSSNLTYQISLSYPFEWGPDSLPTTSVSNHTAQTIYVVDGNAFVTTASEFLKRRKPVDSSQPDALVVGIGYPLTDSVYARTQRSIDFGAPIAGVPLVPHGADDFLNFIDGHLRPWLHRSLFPGVTFSRDALYGHSSGGLFVTWALTHRPQAFDTWIAVSPSLSLRNATTVLGEVTAQFGDRMGVKGQVQWAQNATRPAVFIGYGEEEDWPVRRRTRQTEAQFQTRRTVLQGLSLGRMAHELFDRLVGSGSMRDVVLKGYEGQEHAAAGGSALMDGIAYFLDW